MLILEKIAKIDAIIRKYTWFDMEVYRYDGYKLTITGSVDLSYYHQLEIIFEDVFFVKAHFNGWKTDACQPVFIVPENEYELNVKYEIEQGYKLFMFKTEEMQNNIIIAAKDIHYSDDIVYRYYRKNLKSNERLADFVQAPK